MRQGKGVLGRCSLYTSVPSRDMLWQFFFFFFSFSNHCVHTECERDVTAADPCPVGDSIRFLTVILPSILLPYFSNDIVIDMYSELFISRKHKDV